MNLDDSDIRGQVETMRKYHAAQTATKVRLNFGKVLLAIVAALFFLIGIGVLGGSFRLRNGPGRVPLLRLVLARDVP